MITDREEQTVRREWQQQARRELLAEIDVCFAEMLETSGGRFTMQGIQGARQLIADRFGTPVCEQCGKTPADWRDVRDGYDNERGI